MGQSFFFVVHQPTISFQLSSSFIQLITEKSTKTIQSIKRKENQAISNQKETKIHQTEDKVIKKTIIFRTFAT